MRQTVLAALSMVAWLFAQKTPKENDYDVLPLAQQIGRVRAGAEICKAESSHEQRWLTTAIETAEYISAARYQQAGLTENYRGQNESDAYQSALNGHRASPDLPTCSSLAQQIDQLNALSAREGAAYIRVNRKQTGNQTR